MKRRAPAAVLLGGLAVFGIGAFLHGQHRGPAGGETHPRGPVASAADVRLAGHGAAGGSASSGVEDGDVGRAHPHREATLRGRTTDAAGAPVAGVTVWAAEYRPDSEPFQVREWRQCPSDGAGGYEFASLASDHAVVLAYGPQHGSVGLERSPLAGLEPFVLEVSRGSVTDRDLVVAPLARAVGTLRDAAGRSVPEFPVQAFLQPPDGHWASGTGYLPFGDDDLAALSGPDGAFAIDGLVAGLSYHVRPARSVGRTMAAVAGENGPLELTVDEDARDSAAKTLALGRARAEIRVVDAETGAPVTGATVGVEADGTWAIARRRLPAERLPLGEDGGVVVPDAGPLEVSARADGYFSADYVSWKPGQGTLRIELERGLTIRGDAALPDGTAPAWASVYVQREDPEPDRGELPASRYDGGAFTVSLLREGRYRINIVSALGAGECQADAGDEGVHIELEAAPPSPPRNPISVLGPDGREVGKFSARVYVQGDAGRVAHGYSEYGTLALPTDCDSWIEVFGCASSDGGRGAVPGARLVGPLKPVEPGATVSVRTEAGLCIEGRVVTAAGAPQGGVRIAALPRFSPGLESRYVEGQRWHHALTWSGPDGRFALVGLGPYEYRLVARAPGLVLPVETEFIRAGTADAVLRLPGGRDACVRLVDDRGRPVVGVRLEVLYENPRFGGAEPWRWLPAFLGAVDCRGMARIVGLPPGCTLQLHVHPDDEDAHQRCCCLDWHPEDERIVLGTPHPLEGRVVDLDGAAVPGAWVEATPEDSTWTYWGSHDGGTDGQGHFRIRQLPAGDVRLDVHLNGRRGLLRRTVEVPCEPITLRVEAGGTLRVRFATGELPPATVWCRVSPEGEPDGREPSVRELVRRGESLEVRGLDPRKTYTVFAQRSEGPGEPTFVGLLRGLKTRDAPYECTLTEGGHATVEVTGLPADAHLGYVWVELTDGGVQLSASREKDGAWHLRGIPPGDRSWRVRLRYGHDEPRPTAWTRVRDGDRVTVDLR